MPGGYRFDESTEIVRDCLMGERACPGGNGTGDALCARGYEGPLCAVCSEGFHPRARQQVHRVRVVIAIASISTPLTVLAVLFVVVVLACVSDVLKPLFEYVWSSFGTQSRILWAFTQILAHIPILLSAILPATLRGFYLTLLKITDLNPFAAFGLSCANHALRSFKTRLIFAITAPIVVSAVLLAYALIQVHVLRRNAEKCFTRYAHLQLIVLFLVLPGVSTTIFRTFLCDEGFVEDKSVSFLEADLTLSCESTEYKQLEVLAWFGLLLYPVGVNALYAGLLFRARDAIQHRDGAGAEHLSFLFRSYAPEYFAFDVVDSLRRILLSGGLVFISERGRAAGGTMIALLLLRPLRQRQAVQARRDQRHRFGRERRDRRRHAAADDPPGRAHAKARGRQPLHRHLGGHLPSHRGVPAAKHQAPRGRARGARSQDERSGTGSAAPALVDHRLHRDVLRRVSTRPVPLLIATLTPSPARRFAAGEHSRKEMTAAALEFVEEQLSARPISKAHWDEVTFMLTVFNTHGDGDEALFASVQAIASRLSSACVVEARAMRDGAWAAASEDARARLRGLENFGAVRQPVPEAYLAAVKALVPHAKIQQYALRFDLELMVSAMCCVAETALEHFREKLIALFPKARLIVDVNDMRDDETACVMIASVKNAERVREKIKEAASEHSGDPNMWPFIQLIGDLLRASVILGDFDAFADAWSTLSDGFDVKDGHGRLKNNLWTEAERPPDMLVNVVVEPPGMPSIVGEVQLHLREILVLKESSLHRLYEIVGEGERQREDAALHACAHSRRRTRA